jgi:hypothetical protein
MSKKKQEAHSPDDGTKPEPPAENPVLATQEEIDAALAASQAAPGDPAAVIPVKTRTRRSALQMFADEKAETAKEVEDARQAVKDADDRLQAAIQAEIDFVDRAKAALGL